MKEKWSRMTKTEQALLAAQWVFSAIAVFAAALQLLHIWENANLLTVPSLGIAIFIQSIREWKTNRVTAVFGFLAALGVFLMYSIGLFL